MALRQGRISYHKEYKSLQEEIDLLITLKLKCMHIKGHNNKQMKRTHRPGGDICNRYNYQRITIQNKYRTATNIRKRQSNRQKMAKRTARQFMGEKYKRKFMDETILNLITNRGMQIKTVTCHFAPLRLAKMLNS